MRGKNGHDVYAGSAHTGSDRGLVACLINWPCSRPAFFSHLRLSLLAKARRADASFLACSRSGSLHLGRTDNVLQQPLASEISHHKPGKRPRVDDKRSVSRRTLAQLPATSEVSTGSPRARRSSTNIASFLSAHRTVTILVSQGVGPLTTNGSPSGILANPDVQPAVFVWRGC